MPANVTDLDVVIVNYRSAAHTARCVEALHRVARSDGVTVNIVVVNNADDAASLDQQIAGAGGATVIHNAANVGFGAACNTGAARGAADVILFLNPDAEVTDGCLKTCLAFLRDGRNAAIGIVGPRLTDADGRAVPSCSRLPTAVDLVWRTLGLHFVFPAFEVPYLSAESHAHSGEVGQVMGAALFIRRRLFTALAGFDETYFLYYEDVDLCARAAAVGARTYYLREAEARHIGAGSSSQSAGMALALHVVSRMTYARRTFGVLAQAAVLVAAVLVEFPLRAVRALAGHGRIGAVGTAFRMVLADAFLGRAPR